MQVLIFDEADQLLDMGFRPAIERILNALRSTAATRQTLLFSATMPKDVAQVAQPPCRTPHSSMPHAARRMHVP